MSSFSSADAGLEGFRITRENPKAFLLWVLFAFAVSLIGAVVTVSMPAEVRSALDTLRSEDTPSLTQLGEALLATAPLLVFGLAVQCVMAAAVYRIIFRHDDARLGYLRLGGDELRLMVLTIMILFIVIALLVGVSLGAGVIMAVIYSVSAPAGVFVGVALEVAAMALVIFVLVRLSLAPVATFAERRITVMESWRLTRGHAWKILLANLMAIFCIFLIMLLTMLLFVTLVTIVVTVTGGQFSDIGAFLNPDETSYSAYFNPGMIAYMFVGSIITALWYAVMAAPGAWIYLRLHEAPPARAEPAQSLA
jgi:hypothetical protein